MRRIVRTGILAALTIGTALLGDTLAASAADTPDPANGLKLARRWCAECHVVEPGQTKAQADVPAFAALAVDPLKSDDYLANVLTAPEKAHSRMQNLTLSRVEIMDLAAYIKSLRH